MPNSTDKPISAGEALQELESFFDRIDTGRLFSNRSENDYRDLRRRLAGALNTLLLWQRPFLAQKRGIDWPYAELARRRSTLAALADTDAPAAEKDQAMLFLALLPFPGQWDLLSQTRQESDRHPEIRRFLAAERDNIRHKLSKKHQKTFRLNNFCQVLKRPRPPREKGVLRLFSMLHAFADPALLRELNRSYVLYLEPPWGVVYRNSWLRWFGRLEDPCLVGLGGVEDRRFVDAQPGLQSTPLAHGDFLPEDPAPPSNASKRFDIIFNATFDDMPRKRHRFMLELLGHPLLAGASALFIGTGQAANVDRFVHWVGEMGLAGRVEVAANLPRHTVPDYLARCRIGVHLALNENVCRSVYECFRADLPCVMSAATAGMDLSHLNPQTGATALDEQLPRTIRRLLDQSDDFSPRSWFLTQSGSRNSTRQLNDRLKQLFLRQKLSWREDIAALDSSGPDRYIHEVDRRRFAPEFADLYDLFTRRCPLPVKLVKE